MSVPNGYSPVNLKVDTLEKLREFTRQLAANEHKRVTLSEAVVRAIAAFNEHRELNSTDTQDSDKTSA